MKQPETTQHGNLPVDEPELSVVIVSYNTRLLLLECLESLISAKAEFSMEIIVVDNDSNDGSEEAVRQRFPQVSLIQSHKNLGFGAAMNLGAAKATGRYLLVLNPDTVVPADTLPGLLKYLDSVDRQILVSCRLVGPDGKPQLSCARFPTPLRIIALFTRLGRVLPFESMQAYYDDFDWRQLTLKSSEAQQIRKVDTVLGAFFILPRAEFVKVGGFDERFFMHFEEIDLMKKLELDGCHTYYFPDVCVLHYGGESTKQNLEMMRFEQQRSLLLYLQKWHGTLSAQSIRAFLIILAMLRIIWAITAEKVRPHDRSIRQFRNTSRIILSGLLNMSLHGPGD